MVVARTLVAVHMAAAGLVHMAVVGLVHMVVAVHMIVAGLVHMLAAVHMAVADLVHMVVAGLAHMRAVYIGLEAVQTAAAAVLAHKGYLDRSSYLHSFHD
jgi:hypothetical protein